MNWRAGTPFQAFFHQATGFSPYGWQTLLAHEGLPDVLPVPTGLGKTEVVLAWAWRRLVAGEPEPLHLVYCLPMRSLVTQTVQRLRGYFDRLRQANLCDVAVYQLMGGDIDKEWARMPDRPWILVGTQDQLLTRALNRGYAMNRFEWPVHFGLLNNDCRWLIDEVQLMGPGLWTTSQLDWMRRKRFPSLKPCLTTWMSATLGTSFLSTTDRKRDDLGEPSSEQRAFEGTLQTMLDGDQGLAWWRSAKRPVEWWTPEKPPKTGGTKKSKPAKSPTKGVVTADTIAAAVVRYHRAGTLSLVICNTVDMARDVFRALSVTHKVLLTSRFRREDRSQHEQRLLDFDTNRKAGTLPENDPGLICVSTQVIEAGVDISAHRLWSELAPWPSMLQRLGRLNRKGDDQDARAWFWETPTEKGRGTIERIGPYESADIAGAKKLVDAFAPLSQVMSFAQTIAELNTKCQNDVSDALQPKPSPLPRALDVHGLFSTERDVHGGFTDVSAFVRGTDPDLDVTVFWREWSGDSPPRGDDVDGPPLDPATEGCPVSFVRVQKMLESSKGKAWLWDDEADRWERVNHWDIRPGMLVMLKRDVGGYDTTEGWTGDKAHDLSDVPRAGRGVALRDDSWTEIGHWSRLEDHLADARREAEQMCDALALTGHTRTAVIEASGLHDVGKAHPRWQSALPDRTAIPGALLAKTPRVLAVDVVGDADAIRQTVPQRQPGALPLPDEARRRGREDIVRLRWAIDDRLGVDELKSLRALSGVRWAGHVQFRPGLRHEVASALAMWKKYRDGGADYPALAVYLTATHHGKARTVLRSTTGQGDDVFGVRSDPSTLLLGSEQWPLDFSVAKDGAQGRWEGREFVLTGYGWTGLVADLLGPWRPEEKSEAGVVPDTEPRHLGPFALAYLEALVRVVDWRASERPSASVKLSEVRRVG
ncbi:MAG: DEAD/DEAH box helicase [Acidobacteria bacterium]|nr:DEAD/DEAH box helicase [Acidobacteriota bacterium]